MKNFEKYIDGIYKQVCLKNYSNSEVYGCEGCRFEDEYGHCDEEKKKQWLLEEYQEPIQLTHDEYVILKNLNGIYKFIARDKDTNLVCVYVRKPSKGEFDWWLTDNVWDELCENLFQFIKWEDDEPYSIEKLIANYEKEHKDE